MADAPIFGEDDTTLATRATVFAPEAYADQRVLISGGAGGIGRAIGWLLGRLGAKVILSGRDQSKLDGAVEAMRTAGLDASGHIVDIRDVNAVDAFFTKIEAEGGIDILINSAGGQFPQSAIDMSPRGWNAVVNTNLNGTFFMMQRVARGWRDAQRPGSIVNIVVVTRGLHGVAHTIAARAGVIGLSETLAVEWAPLSIRINCIAPGAIETPGWRVYKPEQVATYARTNPMLRVGTAWEIAEACAWLGGPAARYVTGEVVHVAGGSQLWGDTWTVGRPEWFNPS
jgi:citronellol/citronellal dehydrogenase